MFPGFWRRFKRRNSMSDLGREHIQVGVSRGFRCLICKLHNAHQLLFHSRLGRILSSAVWFYCFPFKNVRCSWDLSVKSGTGWVLCDYCFTEKRINCAEKIKEAGGALSLIDPQFGLTVWWALLRRRRWLVGIPGTWWALTKKAGTH